MELEPLPLDSAATVLATVNEVGNRLQENKKLIREWIKFQPHLPFDTFDERIVGLFLRGTKHNVERTKAKLDMYYTCRSIYPDLFQHRDPFDKSIQQALESFNIVPLPKPSHDGYRYTLHRFTSIDASTFEPKNVFKTMFMVGDIRLIEEPPIVGDIFLFDVQNMTPAHFAKLVSPILKCTLHCTQEAYPQRLSQIHLFNASALIDRVITFFKPFLKEKMRNRFFIHTSIDTLYEYVPQSHLPFDYGGELQTLSELQGFWNKKIKSYKSYFDEQESVKSDERKRLKASKSRLEDAKVFGCEGAFRKLEID